MASENWAWQLSAVFLNEAQPDGRNSGNKSGENVTGRLRFLLSAFPACWFNGQMNSCDDVLDSAAPEIFQIQTQARSPAGSLPLTSEWLLNRPSGDLFGLSLNVGMGWNPAQAADRQFLIVSTQGGLRTPDGKPAALGYHTGHWEIGLLVQAAAEEFARLGAIPFARFCSDPRDGRTQGTTGMFDSLPYRNDAAVLFRRLAHSLPLRAGVLGVATCDKGLPAMMMALAGLPDLPGVIIPVGVTLPATGAEDAGTVQTLGVCYAHGLVSLEKAAELGCRACGTPGGGGLAIGVNGKAVGGIRPVATNALR
jgi:dihydroxyacid dehydratase/phosphogluconate dehydratase